MYADTNCYDCGSTHPTIHTALCDLAPKGASMRLPSKPGTQHWNGTTVDCTEFEAWTATLLEYKGVGYSDVATAFEAAEGDADGMLGYLQEECGAAC